MPNDGTARLVRADRVERWASVEAQQAIPVLLFKIRETKGSPRELALGMALGIFAGLLPIIPFQTPWPWRWHSFSRAARSRRPSARGSAIRSTGTFCTFTPTRWVPLLLGRFREGSAFLEAYDVHSSRRRTPGHRRRRSFRRGPPWSLLS